MNEIASAETSVRLRIAPRDSFYEKLVLSAFQRMNAGHLHLTLPDGEQRTFGTPGAIVSARLRIVNDGFFRRCVLFGDVGFGEAYVEGDWETDDIEAVITWAVANAESAPSISGSKARNFAFNLLKVYNRALHLLRPNSRRIARTNIAAHYDLGNDFYQLWLDPTMTYSSALFSSESESLEEGQFAKYDALCQQLRLSPVDHVLEIGSGWGGFAMHAAQRYGCRVTTVTISQAQHDYCRALFARAGFAHRVQVELKDYRDLTGSFDKIVSIEMMEALGARYLDPFCKQVHALLRPGGIAALQYITVPDCRYNELRRGIDWIQKHIFPGSLLLSVARVTQAMNRTGNLSLHELHDLGLSYARTLRLWRERFQAKHAEVRALGFDERFLRQWDYYLQYCTAAFARAEY